MLRAIRDASLGGKFVPEGSFSPQDKPQGGPVGEVAVRAHAIVSPKTDSPGARRFDDEELVARAGITRREAKKMDRFSLLALAAARAALSSLDGPARRSCGVFCGNTTAGWTFTEPQLRLLHRDGPSRISPYLASSWFPAAAQGQISILLGLRGYAKTLATDRCAGAQAIGLAFRRVLTGNPPFAIAGAAEAPVSPFIEAAIGEAGRPAHLISEAAAFLLLGPAQAGEDSPVIIRDHLTFARPAANTRRVLASRLVSFIKANSPAGGMLPVLCSACCEDNDADLLRSVLREAPSGLLTDIAFPAAPYGETFATSSAIAAAVACERLASSGGASLVVSLGDYGFDALWLTRTSFPGGTHAQ